MATLDIVVFPDERLRVKCKTITKFDDELKQFAQDMFDTMYDDNGLGLAAPQVGSDKRIVVMDVPLEEDGEQGFNKIAMVNPEIIEKSEPTDSTEGCLSVPDYNACINRYNKVKAKYYDLEGKECIIEAEGLQAICIQHELDHLDGKLFIDYLSPLKRDIVLRKYKKLKRAQKR